MQAVGTLAAPTMISVLLSAGHQPCGPISDNIFTKSSYMVNSFRICCKAVCLISRINNFFGNDWKAISGLFPAVVKEVKEENMANIAITCTDNVKSHLDMWSFLKTVRGIRNYTDYRTPLYWMDFGNAQTTGQVIMGTVQKKIPQPKSKQYQTVESLKVITEYVRYSAVKVEDWDRAVRWQKPCKSKIYLSTRHLLNLDVIFFGKCSGKE